MSLGRTLFRNIASSGVGYCVHASVAFLLTPYILSSLGETRYGIWTLAVGLTGYYGLLDLGISTGVTQYLTRYLATKDFDRLNRTASTGFVMLTGCGLVVFIVSLVIALMVSSLFKIPSSFTNEVALVIGVTGASAAIQFAFLTYSGVFVVVQRFDLSNAIGIGTRVLSAVATLASLKLGYGLVGLSIALAATNLIDYLLRWRVAVRILPEMKVSYKLAKVRDVREVMKFGLWNLVLSGSVRLVSYTDALVIAAFMPVSAVAPFAVAASLRTYFDDVFARVGYVFYPAATGLDARGDQSGLRTLYLVSSRFMYLGSISCGLIAIFWARDFFHLWIGAIYAEPSGYPSVATLFLLLVLGSMVSVGQRIGYQVLLGTRRVSLLAGLFVGEGVTNLLVSVILVVHYGLVGVALGTLLPAFLFQGVLQPMFVCRSLQIPLSDYFRQVLLRPILVSPLLVVLLLSLLTRDPPADWLSLLFWASVSVTLASFVVIAVGLSKSEREFVLKRPIEKGLARFRAACSF